MFGNFIYFIVVLLIYSTYLPASAANFTARESFLLCIGLSAVFFAVTGFRFQRVLKRLHRLGRRQLDQWFTTAVTRHSILAIAVFAADTYGLNLPVFTGRIPLFSMLPTLQALFFLGFFILHLLAVWWLAYPAYREIYGTAISRRAYLLSQLTFSLPILLPWIFLSGIADIIDILPFDLPRQLLATTGGEITYFLFFLGVVAVFGPVLIQKFWRCRPLPAGPDRQRIEAVCRQAGIGYADILSFQVFGAGMITAAVMGLVKKFRYILVTPDLLRFLEPEEVESVIAHEAGHVRYRHLMFYLLFFAGYLVLSYAGSDLILFALFFLTPADGLTAMGGAVSGGFTATLYSLVLILIFIVYFRFIFGYFMRNFERQADGYVYFLKGTVKPLVSSFEKIVMYSGQSPDKPNWHHFSIRQRIDFLKKCESDPIWIARHNAKVRKGIAVFLVMLILAGLAGYQVNYGETGRQLNSRWVEKALHREIGKAPDNPDLYSMLGDFYYSRKNYPETIRAYETALRLAPELPEVLNNLAWLLATCENRQLRDPEKALAYARRAARLKTAPHILDTLAESYYVNGDYRQAIETETKAIHLAGKDTVHFERQLEKFQKAAGLQEP